MMRYSALLMLSCLLASFLGCDSARHQRVRQTLNYQTLPGNAARNVQLAQQHHARAVELIEKQKLNEAESELKRALEADVTFGPAHNNLGKIYYEQGQHYLAAWEFQYAIKLMPNQPEPRNNLGLVYESVGKLQDAIDQYQHARNSAPDHPDVLANLARARIRQGDKSPDLLDLLREVAMKDDRPQWSQWARRELSLRGVPVVE